MSAETLQILLVDDNESHIELIRRAFVLDGMKADFTLADTLAKARQLLKDAMPDLMLIDFRLPDGEGLELLPGELEQRTAPIIIMTGQGDEKVAAAAIKAGAMDYIVKSMETFADMPRIVERTLREWNHIIERRRAEEKLRLIARLGKQAAGDGFFRDLATSMASILKVKVAFVAEFVMSHPVSAHSLAIWVDEAYTGKMQWHLSGTPCEQVANGEEVLITEGAQAAFPDDSWLSEVGIEAYMAIPMLDSRGRAIGHIGVMDDKPIHQAQEIREFLNIFSDRVAAELERRRAEEKLRESNNRLNLVLDATNEGVWDWNIQTGVVFFSARWKASLGYSEEEVPNHVSFWEQAVHPDDFSPLKFALQKHFDGETASYAFENRLRMKNGEYRWNLDRGKVVEWDADGKPLRMVGTDTDITERRKAEEDIRYRLHIEQVLAEVSRQFATAQTINMDEILRLLGQGIGANRAYIFQFDNDGKKMSNSHEWCAAGTEPQIDNLQEMDVDIFPWWMKKMHAGENILIPDVSLLAADAAAEKDILQQQDIRALLVVPMFSLHGALFGFMGFDDTEKTRTWKDEDAKSLRVAGEMMITYLERRRAEAALQTSELRFRTLVEQSPFSIQVLSPQGWTLQINRAWEELWGIGLEQLKDYNMLEDQQFIEAGLMPSIRKGFGGEATEIAPIQYHMEENPLVSAPVNHRWVRGWIYPLKDSADHIREVIVMHEDISERIQNDRKLQLSQYSIDHSSDAAFWIDQDARFVNVNETACQRLGYRRDELLAMSIFDIDTEFPRESWPEHWRQLKKRGSFHLESIHKTGSGETFPVDISCNYVCFDDMEYSFTFAADITERRRSNEKLFQFERIVSSSTDMMALLDRDFIYRCVNPAYLATFKKNYDEVVGHSVQEVLGEQFFHEVVSQNAKRCLAGEEINYLDWFDFPDCAPRYMDIHYYPYFNADNEVSGFVMNGRDVTERRQAEDTLRKLSSAIEQAGESVIITDKEGMIEYANPAFTNMTGYAAEEAIGKTPRLLKSGNQDAAFYESMWKTITAGNIWHGKVVDRRKDGSFYPAMLTISPIFDQSGDPDCCSHYVGIQSDLTEIEDLEKQFHQAQKMEAIGTLVGGIAHDFNNMLAGMTGNLYLAKKQTAQMPEAVQKLANIEEIAFRAAAMIRQLLTFARKGVVSMQEMPFTPFIKETLKLLRSSVPENIAVFQDVCTENLHICGDATQLHQVLMNLVNNARDAVEEADKPCIHIRLDVFHPDNAFIKAHAWFRDEAYAHLSVADNGCGIPEDQIKHLFEPFFTTKEQGRGTGLGLAMVFGAIKTHHGFVEVESKEGEGSSFHIYLPLLKSKEIAAVSVQEEAVVEGSGELILLADDEADVLETAREVLESLGYKVLTASNGKQALEIFENSCDSIELCLLDVVMPVLGGDQVAKAIRRIDPDARIIFSTGYDKNLLSRLKDEIVLTKPFSIEGMSQLIRRQLGPDSS